MRTPMPPLPPDFMAMDLDSSKDGDFHGSVRCSFGDEAATKPSVTPGASPVYHSWMEGDGSSHQSLPSFCVICMSVRSHSCDLGSCRGDTQIVFSDFSPKLSLPDSTDFLISPRNPTSPTPKPAPIPLLVSTTCPTAIPMPSKKKKPKEAPTSVPRSRKMPDGPISRLINETGTKHVYCGKKGEPITNNPGNKRFRRIVAKYDLEYARASKHAHKLEIKKRILKEVKSGGSKFFFIVETKNGNVSQKRVGGSKILAKTGHALRDTWKYRANWWSWADPAHGHLSWSDFSNKDGTALEKMFQQVFRQKVKVTVREEKHLVDVSSMIMHRVDDNVINYLVVRRMEPEDEIDGGEQIFVSDESDGQDDASSSAESSGSQDSEASGTATRSSFHRTGGGAGGVQANLCCSLGNADQFTDESLVFAIEALDEDVFEEITAALEGERAVEEQSSVPPCSLAERETRSAHPPPVPTDPGTSGVLAPWLVKRGITLSFAKKKKDPTDKKKQDKGIPTQQEAIWLWRESTTRMSRHSSDAIVGDPKDCWVRYDEESAALLEACYKAQNGVGECSPNSKYTVDFGLMLQINVSTGFPREVRRLESTPFKAPKREDHPSSKRSIIEIERKLGNMRVHETADDMTAPTTTAETSMGL